MCLPPWNAETRLLSASMSTWATVLAFLNWNYLGGGDAVNEADLLKSFLTHGQADLPAIIHSFIHHLQGDARLIQFVLYVEIHVAPEPIHLWARQFQVSTNNTPAWLF